MKKPLLLEWREHERDGHILRVRCYLKCDPTTVLFHLNVMTGQMKRAGWLHTLYGAFLPDREDPFQTGSIVTAKLRAEESVRAWLFRVGKPLLAELEKEAA